MDPSAPPDDPETVQPQEPITAQQLKSPRWWLRLLALPVGLLVLAAAIVLLLDTSFGHRFISDLLYGSVSHDVRHAVNVPVLLLKAK